MSSDAATSQLIADALFSDQGSGARGRPSVVLGPGVSLTSDRSSQVEAPVGLAELKRRIHQELRPDDDASALRDISLPDYMDVFEQRFGRAALNDLSVRVTADDHLRPSIVHEKLVSLPWRNIFDLNIDTLVERSEASKRYSVVSSPADVANSASPRIYKMRGRVPDILPLVLTSEGLRVYEKYFALYANILRQSAIEGPLLFTGFSIDDPYYQKYLEIIEKLQNSTPQSFFVSARLNEIWDDAAELQRRNILPINLSDLNLVDGDQATPVELLSTWLSSLTEDGNYDAAAKTHSAFFSPTDMQRRRVIAADLVDRVQREIERIRASLPNDAESLDKAEHELELLQDVQSAIETLAEDASETSAAAPIVSFRDRVESLCDYIVGPERAPAFTDGLLIASFASAMIQFGIQPLASTIIAATSIAGPQMAKKIADISKHLGKK